jgi:hypothetical protein
MLSLERKSSGGRAIGCEGSGWNQADSGLLLVQAGKETTYFPPLPTCEASTTKLGG